jgi:hypothetical protein
VSIAQAAGAAVATFPDVPVSTPYGVYPLPVVMVAIAGAETGGTFAVNAAGDPATDYPGVPSCSGWTSFGLWQVHLVHGALLQQLTGSADPCVWASWLAVPANCAQAALQVMGPEHALTPWTTWNEGTYSGWLPDAEAAVRAALGAGGPPGGNSSGVVPARSTPWGLIIGATLLIAGGGAALRRWD